MAHSFEGLRVLVACDDDDTRELLALIARGRGAVTFTTRDHRTTLRALDQFAVDVVIVAEALAALRVAVARPGAAVGARIDLPTSSHELVDAILRCTGNEVRDRPAPSTTSR